MKKIFIGVIVLSLVLSFSICAGAGIDPKQLPKYLSVAELEKATGIKGITTDHNTTLRFFNKQRNMILLVRFDTDKAFAEQTKDKTLWRPVQGIGDKAMFSVPKIPLNIAFTKGPHMVDVGTFPSSGTTTKTFITFEQLKAICKIIEAKIPKTPGF